MLFFMGASACGLMREAIIQQRYANAQRQARRALHVPMGRVRVGETPLWEGSEQEWESFACYHLCLTCGYLAESGGELCPGCGHRGWTDLRNVAAADAIRQMERRDRQVIPDRIKAKSQWVATGAGLAAAGALGAGVAGGMDAMMPGLLVGAVGFGGVFALSNAVVSSLWNNLHFRQRPTYPSRWHLPVPQARRGAKPTRSVTGPLHPVSELILAPVSRLPCVGYELTVLFDAAGDKRPPMWILEEEKNLAFTVDGQRFEAGRVTLDLPATQVAQEDGSADLGRVVRLLRQRGLFASEGEYVLFEALVEPDETYRVDLFDEPKGAAAVIRPA